MNGNEGMKHLLLLAALLVLLLAAFLGARDYGMKDPKEGYLEMLSATGKPLA